MDIRTCQELQESLWSIETCICDIKEFPKPEDAEKCWQYLFNISEVLIAVMNKQTELEGRIKEIEQELDIRYDYNPTSKQEIEEVESDYHADEDLEPEPDEEE